MLAQDTSGVSLPPTLLAALDPYCGAVRVVRAFPRLTPAGMVVQSCIVKGAAGQWVVKRMGYERDPGTVGSLLNHLRAAGMPCPRLVQGIPLADEWAALFTFEAGASVGLTDPVWPRVWEEALVRLEQLHKLPPLPPHWRLESLWQARLKALPFEGAAAALWDHLQDSPPLGLPTLAHGDFAPQNFLWTEAGLMLIDWEEIGWAAPAFDAGWLLALNRVGAGPRLGQASLFASLIARGFPAHNLRWFEGLGLLRMLYRRWVPDGVPIPVAEQQLSTSLRLVLQQRIAEYLAQDPASS